MTYVSPIPTYDQITRELVNLRRERDKLLRERDGLALTASNYAARINDLRADLARAQAMALAYKTENDRLKGNKAGGGRPMSKTIGKTT